MCIFSPTPMLSASSQLFKHVEIHPKLDLHLVLSELLVFVPQSRPPRPTPEKSEKKVREKIAHPNRWWGRLHDHYFFFFHKKQQHEIEFQGDCGRQADDVQTSKTGFPSSGKKKERRRREKKGNQQRQKTSQCKCNVNVCGWVCPCARLCGCA